MPCSARSRRRAGHLGALGLAAILCACGGTAELGPGHFEGSVFVHEGLGMRLAFPSDWLIVKPEESDDISRSGREILSGGDPTGGSYRAAGDPTSQTLFTVYRYPRGTMPGINPSLVGGLENILARPQIQTAVDYLQMLQSFLARGGVPMKFDTIVPGAMLAGQEFAVMGVTIQPEDIPIGQIYYCRRVDDQILTLVATFTTPQQWAELETVLGGLTLSR